MGRAGTAVGVVLFIGSLVQAGEIGSPEPTAKEGKGTVGVGYSFSKRRFEPDNKTDFVSDTLQLHKGYLEGSFGFFKDWEGFLRVGGVSLKAENAISFSSTDRRDLEDDGFFGTIGFRGLLADKPEFGFGPFVQVSTFSDFEDSGTGNVSVGGASGPISEKLEIEGIREGVLGIAFRSKLERATLYGGPFLYWGRYRERQH